MHPNIYLLHARLEHAILVTRSSNSEEYKILLYWFLSQHTKEGFSLCHVYMHVPLYFALIHLSPHCPSPWNHGTPWERWFPFFLFKEIAKANLTGGNTYTEKKFLAVISNISLIHFGCSSDVSEDRKRNVLLLFVTVLCYVAQAVLKLMQAPCLSLSSAGISPSCLK